MFKNNSVHFNSFCFIITEFKVIRGVEYQSEYTYSIGLIKFYSIFSIFFNKKSFFDEFYN